MIHPVRSTPVSYLYNPHATNAPVSDLFLDKNFYEQVVECDILDFFCSFTNSQSLWTHEFSLIADLLIHKRNSVCFSLC